VTGDSVATLPEAPKPAEPKRSKRKPRRPKLSAAGKRMGRPPAGKPHHQRFTASIPYALWTRLVAYLRSQPGLIVSHAVAAAIDADLTRRGY
jgi:hypothetical protein